MNATNNATNPYEFNTDSIPEHNWFYTTSIVIKQPASEFGFRKIKNKEVIKWLYSILKEKIIEERFVPYTKWFATCTSEIQKESTLLHFHLIYGNLFNRTTAAEKVELVESMEWRKKTAIAIQQLILTSPFLGGELKYYEKGVLVTAYKPKKDCIRADGKQASWIGYKFKKEQNPYWSDYYQKIVTMKNAADADDGVIPEILFDLGFTFHPLRKQQHNLALSYGYVDGTKEQL